MHIILEALKIHKVRHEKAVQLWFVILYCLNLLPYVMPFGDRDFSQLADAMDSMMEGVLPSADVWLLLTPGNMLVLGMILAASLITMFFGLVYASLIVAEHENLKPADAVKKSLSALPALLLFGLILFIPAVFSAFALFIPLILFLLMMYFLPLNLVWSKQSLSSAIRHSYRAMHGHKLFVFIHIVLLVLIVSLPQNLILGLAPQGGMPYILLATFFAVFRALINGRLMGLLYLNLVKKVPFVIPSRPKQR